MCEVVPLLQCLRVGLTKGAQGITKVPVVGVQKGNIGVKKKKVLAAFHTPWLLNWNSLLSTITNYLDFFKIFCYTPKDDKKDHMAVKIVDRMLML